MLRAAAAQKGSGGRLIGLSRAYHRTVDGVGVHRVWGNGRVTVRLVTAEAFPKAPGGATRSGQHGVSREAWRRREALNR
jgi:hypothetical protein